MGFINGCRLRSGSTFTRERDGLPIFTDNSNSRTIDFKAGDTAAFPDNFGYVRHHRLGIPVWHSVKLTYETQPLHREQPQARGFDLDQDAQIGPRGGYPLTHWLALTPADIVAQTLHVPVEFVERIRKEKQVLLE